MEKSPFLNKYNFLFPLVMLVFGGVSRFPGSTHGDEPSFVHYDRNTFIILCFYFDLLHTLPFSFFLTTCLFFRSTAFIYLPNITAQDWCCRYEGVGCAPVKISPAPMPLHNCHARPIEAWSLSKMLWCCRNYEAFYNG